MQISTKTSSSTSLRYVCIRQGGHIAARRCKHGNVARKPATRRRPKAFAAPNSRQRAAHIVPQAAQSSKGRVSVLPAGQRQAKVTLPGVLLSVTSEQVAGSEGGAVLEAISQAVASGATGVVLQDSQSGDAGQLYDAALALKQQLRERVPLLVLDRTDIAAAAEADGVLLSSKGVPIAVASRMLGGASALIGCNALGAGRAVEAASEGANLIVLQDEDGCSPSPEVIQASTQQRGGAIPVFAQLSAATLAQPSPQQTLRPLIGAGCSGLCLMVEGDEVGALAAQVKSALAAFAAPAEEDTLDTKAFVEREEGVQVERLRQVEHNREDMLEAERRLLSRVLAALKQSSPDMEEVSLLEDALSQLDELFLLVVVGEFNSGKSSVINSLLGSKYLAEGILPTTNEISVLKHAADGVEKVVQDQDGFYTRYLPAELLKDVNIVDTPGTNVILDRQQRLTEEYVPRADLVLFVMSADRPFTDSEVRFLKYIKQWGKKVVFIVNKCDILEEAAGEVEEVRQFVADNAARILGVEQAQVLPVSARLALKAKSTYNGVASTLFSALSPTSPLLQDNQWQNSKFGELERFVYEFLLGGKGGGESMRLKLQTPLFIAEALLNASQQQLAIELANAQQELQALRLVEQQLDKFGREMARDAAVQRAEVQRVVTEALEQVEEAVDDTLKISNIDAISTYLLGTKEDAKKLPVSQQLQSSVLGEGLERLKGMVEEHSSWIQMNCDSQQQYYHTFAEQRAQEMGTTLSAVSAAADGDASQRPARSGNEDLSTAESRRQWREAREAVAAESKEGGNASVVLSQLQPESALAKLDSELREAVIGTAGTAAGAAALGVVTTWILPTTLEDMLAMALAGAVAYTSVLNLPLRRADTKKKLKEAAQSFVQELDAKMLGELDSSVLRTRGTVLELVSPLQQYAAQEVARVEVLQAKEQALMQEVAALKQQTANVE